MPDSPISFEQFCAFVQEVSEQTSEIILKHYRHDLAVDYKEDESPVTIADRDTEEFLRGQIREKFPSHGIIGEEFESENPDADYQWVLDPIDGTKSFVAGVPLFGTLIALLQDQKPLFGAMHLPVSGDLLLGNSTTTLLNGIPIQRKEHTPLKKSVVLTTDYKDYSLYQDPAGLERLLKACRISRTWGDCFGYYLLVSGGAQVMVDPILSVWDKMALIPIIRGIGGEITTYAGGDPAKGENIVATLGGIHKEVLALLNGD